MVRRHNDVRDCLGRICQLAFIGVEIEKNGLSEKSRERPADIFIPNWKDGKDAWVDVAIINPSCNTYLKNSSQTLDYAINNSAKKKVENYQELVASSDTYFIPFIMDVNGRVNRDGELFLARLATFAASHNNVSQKSILANNRLQLSFKVLNSVAAQILRAGCSRLGNFVDQQSC